MSLRARWSFRERLALLVLTLAGAAVIAAGLVLAGSARVLLEDRAVGLLEARTEQLAGELDTWHRNNLERARALAAQPTVVGWCRSRPEERLVRAPAVRATIAAVELPAEGRLAGRVLDQRGYIAVATDPQQEGRDVSFRAYVRQVMRGDPVVSDLYGKSAGEDSPQVHYAAPILGLDGKVACAAVVSVRAADLVDRVRSFGGKAGDGSGFVVVDRYGLRIAGARDEELYRPIATVDPDSTARLIADQRFGADTSERIASALPLDLIHRTVVRRSLAATLWTVVGSIPREIAAPPYRRLVIEVVSLAAALVLLVLLVLRFSARGLLAPLEPVGAALLSLSRGDLRARVANPEDDEIGRIGARLNEMADSLESSRRVLETRVRERTLEIERLTESVDTARGREKGLEAEKGAVERKVRALDAIARERAEFLSGLSAQLGASLSSLLQLSEILIGESRGRFLPEQLQAAEEVLAGGRHLHSVTRALLELFRIEAGHLNLNLVPISPGAAIRAACALVRPWALKRNITISEMVDTTVPVMADAGKLRQILLSLLTNAIKFSPEGATVRVGAIALGAEVRFTVDDAGPGIEPQRMARVFEPLAAGGAPLASHPGGSGLGLAITRRLVERQGGLIGVESKPGSGSTFFFTVPVSPGPGVVPLFLRAPLEADKVLRTVSLLTKGVATSGPPALLLHSKAPKTLELLRELLPPSDARIVPSEQGSEVLDLAVREKPAVVVIDLAVHDDATFELVEAFAADARSDARPLLTLLPDGLGDHERSALEQRVRNLVERGNLARGVLAATMQKITGEWPALAREETPRGPPVLVVDEDPVRRDLARSLLERKGYRVLITTDGASGIALARRERPALILMDLGLRDKHGFTAARELKADSATASIPIVALSTVALAEDEQRAAGFDGYLAKPLDGEALEAIVGRLVGP